MKTTVIKITPQLQQWYDSLKLKPINVFKHDLFSGYIIAQIFNKIYPNFELRSFANSSSIELSIQNWNRILQLQTQLNLPTSISEAKIQKVINNEDEQTLFSILVELFTLHTKQNVQEFKIQANSSIKKYIPIQTVKLNSSMQKEPAQVTKQIEQYPENIPVFCRGTYVNSRKLINHVSEVCKDAIGSIPDIREFIEMIDPRTDFCFPFPQLMWKLPTQYCTQVCQNLIDSLSVELVVDTLLFDFTQFGDFFKIVVHSVIAVNQITQTKLFDAVTNLIIQVLQQIKQRSEDVVYMIFSEICSKLLPELPLVNFSLVHFFKICLTCVNLTPIVFNQLIQISLNNLKQNQKNVGENRLRLEVLIAFTVLSQDLGKYKEQLARSCIKFAIHGELLRDQEKYAALDLMARCFCLNPNMFHEFEFQYFRIINVLVNQLHMEENIMHDFEQVLQISFKNDVKLEFMFDNMQQLNYEQVLFLVKQLNKLELLTGAHNLKLVCQQLETKLITDLELPPCHFFIGITAVLHRQANNIDTLNKKFTNNHVKHMEHLKQFNEAMQANEQLNLLLENIITFLRKNMNYLPSILCLLDAQQMQHDIIYSYYEQNQIKLEQFINQPSNMISLENEGESVTKLKAELPPQMYENILTIYNKQKLDKIAPLIIIYLSSLDIDLSVCQLMNQFQVVNLSQSQYLYHLIGEELFSLTLSEDKQFSSAVIDLVMLILVEMNLQKILLDNNDDVRNTLQALLDCCFGYQRKEMEYEKKHNLQGNCIRLMNQLKQDIGIRVILVDMFEKMDYETYGNDHLEKLISEIAGDV